MKHSFLLLLISFIFIGCNPQNPVESVQSDDSGKIILKIDRANAPSSVAVIHATLSRSGYQSITSEMNLLTDSTADLELNEIPVGKWFLQISAKNTMGVTEYSGETEVNIVQNTIIQVALTLYPVPGQATGGIYILVNWGENNYLWKDGPENPLITLYQNPSNPVQVSASKVLYDNGIYKMWYMAVHPGAVANIWYAESPDGKVWNTIGNKPVLAVGDSGSWDSYCVGIQSIIKEETGYKMWYLGVNAHQYTTSYKIGLATSIDGKSWQKLPYPVLTESGEYFRMGLTSVVKKDSIYYGFISYQNSSYTQNYIGVVYSQDGLNWSYYGGNPILTADKYWEGGSISYPAVVYEDGKFRMYYSNRQQDAIGYAESEDGLNFVKEIQPVFTRHQTSRNWLFVSYPNYIKVNDAARIYYSGFNTYQDNAICYTYK